MAKQEDKRDAKSRLMEAATELFAEKGFAAVSVREICNQAGTGNNMVHHYFGSKLGLQDAVLNQFSAEIFSVPMRIMEKLPDSKAEFISRFELFVEETLEALIANRDVFSMLMKEELMPDNSPFAAYTSRFILFIDHGKQKGFVNETIEPFMLTGLVIDRLSNQVLYANIIKQTTGCDIVGDNEYKRQWLKANLNLFLYGFTSVC